MASFTVASGKCVQYDGRLRYGGNGTTYVVNDTYDNYLSSVDDVAAGNITMVVDFVNNVDSDASETYVSKTVDFSTTAAKGVATHRVFDVTGAVRTKILAECTTSLVGSANTAVIALGTGNGTSSFIGGTSAELIDAGEVWCDSTVTETDGAYGTLILDKVVVSTPIGYEIGTASMSTGVITFHCWYTPLNATGNVQTGNLSTMA